MNDKHRNSECCDRGGAAVLLCAVLCLANPAHAWNYEEHFEITLVAYLRACSLLRAEGTAPAGWCASNHARVCMAHLVATAADHVGSVDRLRARDGSSTDYLVGAQLDCRSPAGWHGGPPALPGEHNGNRMARDTPVPDLKEEKVKPLVASNLSRALEYARLAAANFEHFQPDSRDIWEGTFRQWVSGNKTESLAVNEVIWHAGFALHFLQDSFSAGHNGLQRKPFRQDYAQIYHDDFNSHGVPLSNPKGQEWFGYGDGNLNKETRYVFLSARVAAGGEEPAASWLKGLGELDVKDAISAQQLAEFRLSKEPWRILSAARADGGREPRASTFLCSLADACSKNQVVLVNDRAEVVVRPRAGCTAQSTTSGMPYWVCDDSRWFVVEATTWALRALLLRLAGTDAEAVTVAFDEAERFVPTAYRTISPRFGGGGLNAEPRPIRPTALRSLNEPVPLDFSDWAYGADCVSATPTGGRRCAFVFGLYVGSGLEDLHAGTRFSIVDSSRKFVNGFDFTAYYSPKNFRVFENVLGISPKLSTGIERMLEGKQRRGYVGLGVSLDAHFGKTKVFVDCDALAFRRANALQGSPHRITVGLKLGSISLFQPADFER